MGLIAGVLEVISTDKRGDKVTRVKGDPAAKNNKLSDQYSAPGDDSKALPGDWHYLGETERKGFFAALGFLDPKNSQKSNPGEKRIYARDAEGNEVVDLWLKNDATAILENEVGKIELNGNGTITLNNQVLSATFFPGGYLLVENAVGRFEMFSSGNININSGCIVQPGGTIIAPQAIIGGVTQTSHGHPYTWTDPGGSSVTGPPQN